MYVQKVHSLRGIRLVKAKEGTVVLSDNADFYIKDTTLEIANVCTGSRSSPAIKTLIYLLINIYR